MWEIFLGPLSVCVSRDEGAQYFILLSMSYRSREVWLLACTNVTTSKRDPDTNLGPNVWTTVLWWPNKRPARVQLAKILVALISVTYPIATGVRCHCPIVASGLNPVHPLVFHATIIFTISSFCRAAPLLFTSSPQFPSIYTTVGFWVWFPKNCARDFTKSEIWFLIWRNPCQGGWKHCGWCRENVLRCRRRHLPCRHTRISRDICQLK